MRCLLCGPVQIILSKFHKHSPLNPQQNWKQHAVTARQARRLGAQADDQLAEFEEALQQKTEEAAQAIGMMRRVEENAKMVEAASIARVRAMEAQVAEAGALVESVMSAARAAKELASARESALLAQVSALERQVLDLEGSPTVVRGFEGFMGDTFASPPPASAGPRRSLGTSPALSAAAAGSWSGRSAFETRGSGPWAPEAVRPGPAHSLLGSGVGGLPVLYPLGSRAGRDPPNEGGDGGGGGHLGRGLRTGVAARDASALVSTTDGGWARPVMMVYPQRQVSAASPTTPRSRLSRKSRSPPSGSAAGAVAAALDSALGCTAAAAAAAATAAAAAASTDDSRGARSSPRTQLSPVQALSFRQSAGAEDDICANLPPFGSEIAQIEGEESSSLVRYMSRLRDECRGLQLQLESVEKERDNAVSKLASLPPPQNSDASQQKKASESPLSMSVDGEATSARSLPRAEVHIHSA
mmetsp:Transcript_67514/g.180405  ORF Transcript_67514/g.180405 Transcript_67514/m.180405 type:complete len:471 (-) Transcript_67514:485-1897(-)